MGRIVVGANVRLDRCPTSWPWWSRSARGQWFGFFFENYYPGHKSNLNSPAVAAHVATWLSIARGDVR